MTAPRLTAPQRNLLRKLIANKSAMQGAGTTSKPATGATLRALVGHGLVLENLTVTPAGRAVFAPAQQLEGSPS